MPLPVLLTSWAERNRALWPNKDRANASPVQWLMQETGLPRRLIARLLAGDGTAMEPLLRKFVVLHERDNRGGAIRLTGTVS